MNRQDPHWIAWLERIYAATLRLYPRRFHAQWEQPMRQAFRDRCREVARGQRSPLRLATELLPDLAIGVAREQVVTLEETTVLRRNVLFALVLAMAGTLVFFDRIDTALAIGLQDAHQWWVDREHQADSDAITSYRTALADVVVADAETARDHATAALLYAGGGLYFKSDDAYAPIPVLQVGSRQAIATRNGLAQQQWNLAVAGNDPLALWLSVVDCPVSQCDAFGALSQLERQQPSNAAVTLLQIDRALANNNAAELHLALNRIAQATYYHGYNGELMQALLRTDGKAPLPYRLRSMYQGDGQASAMLLSQALWLQRSQGEFTRFRNYCKPATTHAAALPVGQAHSRDCIAMARLMATSDSLFPRAMGLRIWYQLVHGQPEALLVRQRMRDFRWQLSHGWWQDMRDPAGRAVLRKAWLESGSEVAALHAWLRQRGLPIAAPDDFQVDEHYFDPNR